MIDKLLKLCTKSNKTSGSGKKVQKITNWSKEVFSSEVILAILLRDVFSFFIVFYFEFDLNPLCTEGIVTFSQAYIYCSIIVCNVWS